jgi:hypothetical protein
VRENRTGVDDPGYNKKRSRNFSRALLTSVAALAQRAVRPPQDGGYVYGRSVVVVVVVSFFSYTVPGRLNTILRTIMRSPSRT